MGELKAIKTTKLGGKIWLTVIVFGLIGQIAWIVENMYFAKFMQNEIEGKAYATTLMVIFSAIFATGATIIGGGLCDKTGKRKVFICWGYILWGLSTMAFALIPLDFSSEKRLMLVVAVIAMDCIMSYIGATANDAAFNTWITDITDTTNRGKVDVALAIMPVVSMVIVFLGLDSLTNGHWATFFVVLGAIPIIGGIAGFFMLKDSSKIVVQNNGNYWADIFFGFKKDIIKNNKMLYICLFGSTLSGASIQVYQPYLINLVEKTLKITDYALPLGAIVLLSALLSVVISVMMDKFGKEKFYYPTIILNVVGGLLVYTCKFFVGNSGMLFAILIVGGTAVMAASLIMAGLFIGAFRDYIPSGKEGCFQGVRMFMFVLIPMIIGPIFGMIICNLFGWTELINGETVEIYPMELFLGGIILAALVFLPAYYVKRNDRIIRGKLIAERDGTVFDVEK